MWARSNGSELAGRAQGTVLQKLGPVTYEVKVNGSTWRRHTNQVLRFQGSAQSDDSNVLDDNELCGLTKFPGGRSGVKTLPDNDGSETLERTPLDATDNGSEEITAQLDVPNEPETSDGARPYPS